MSAETMTGWEQVGIGALASLLAAIIAVYLTNRHSRVLAARSGAFRRPNLGLTLLGQAASSPNPPLAWCFRHPGQEDGKEEQPAFYSFPFDLTNDGDAKCEDVVVTFTGPAFCFGNPEGTASSTIPGVFEGLVARSQNNLGNLTLVAHKVDRVGANSSVSIWDLVILQPSVNHPHTVHATTKDNVGVDLQLIYTFAYDFRWHILTPDDRSINVKTPIYCIVAPTKEAVANEFKIVLAEMIQSHLNDAGRWERLRYIFLRLGIWRKVVIADFGTPEIISIKGQKGQKGQKLYRLDKETNKAEVLIANCFVPRFMER